jgi:hypothetical protein
MNPREMLLVMSACAVAFVLIAVVAAGRRRQTDLRRQRLDVLAAALRDPTIDAATRGELARALLREQRGAIGWLWHQLQKPILWRVLWFGTGWIALILSATVVAMASAGWMRGVDRTAVLLVLAASFAMVTLPLALRELLRRERVA